MISLYCFFYLFVQFFPYKPAFFLRWTILVIECLFHQQ